MNALLDAINRLNQKLDEAAMNDAIADLSDMCDMLEGIVPGFVSPFPSQPPPA